MTPDQRLARIALGLRDAGIEALVMGGHAVRYYGVDRNTIDYDFFASIASTGDLQGKLARSALFPNLQAGPSWRQRDFARFEIGRLPDGREEWLEFWFRNHLLPDFGQLFSRREQGYYGGEQLPFISLSDLLRSKETERESDWQDIALLEEIQDARHLAAATTEAGVEKALSHLRSRRGFSAAIVKKLFDNQSLVRRAIAQCEHPVSFAFLLPCAADAPQPQTLRMAIDSAHIAPLRVVGLATTKHLPLVEVVRRAHKRWAMNIDRLDKQSQLPTP